MRKENGGKGSFACCLMAGVVLFVVAVQPVGADTIELAYQFLEAGGNQGVVDGVTWSGANGLMKFESQNPVGAMAQQVPDEVWGYCIELEVESSFDWEEFTVQSLEDLVGTSEAAMLRQLWETRYDEAWQSDTPIYYGGSYGGWQSGEPANTQENQEALAFSFCIYEILWDFDGTLASLDLSDGDLTADAGPTNPVGAITVANAWLADLELPGDYTGPLADLVVGFGNSSLQDLIIEIPEPATMAMLSVGVLALLRRRR